MQGKPMDTDDLIEELNASQVASFFCKQAAARLATYEAALKQIRDQSVYSEWNEHTRELARNNAAIARKALES